jgi:hypothetical protein
MVVALVSYRNGPCRGCLLLLLYRSLSYIVWFLWTGPGFVSPNYPIILHSLSHLILNITRVRWSTSKLRLPLGILEFGCFTAFSLPASFYAKIFVFAKTFVIFITFRKLFFAKNENKFSRKYENKNFRFNPTVQVHYLIVGSYNLRTYMFLLQIPFKGCQSHMNGSNGSSIYILYSVIRKITFYTQCQWHLNAVSLTPCAK